MLLYLRWQQGAFILLSDDDALLFAHCDAPLLVHTMGECVSACTLLVYLHLRYRATAY